MSLFLTLFVIMTAGAVTAFAGVMMFAGARQHEEMRRRRGVVIALSGSILNLSASLMILVRHIAPSVPFLQWIVG